jgi:hypothetical protein
MQHKQPVQHKLRSNTPSAASFKAHNDQTNTATIKHVDRIAKGQVQLLPTGQ